jgi:aminocarboxymuconate-semialdehyde decarboxylase
MSPGSVTPRVGSIDVHAHVVLAEVMGAAGRHGPWLADDGSFRVGDFVLRGVPYRDSPFMDLGLRMAAMDRAGIAVQALSPNPLTFFHRIDANAAIRFCSLHNDALAAAVAEHPDRLLGLAALPMQDVPAAIDELDRAVGDLGLRGAYVGTDLGVPLDHGTLDPFYARLVELDVPLFLHPAPAAVDQRATDPRMGRFDLELLLGFAHEESLAVATLVFGGVLERHPGLDVCVSHGGGAIAFLAGRLAAAAQHRSWAPASLRPEGAFLQVLGRLWYDVHVHDPRALALLAAVVGHERLVLGTNFAGWDQSEPIADDDVAASLSHNAARLLRLTGVAHD